MIYEYALDPKVVIQWLKNENHLNWLKGINGIGIGIIANVFFVIGTENKIDYIRLGFIAFFAIILLILSSIEKE